MELKENSAWKFLVKVLLANKKGVPSRRGALFFSVIITLACDSCSHLEPGIMRRDLADSDQNVGR